MQQSAFTLLELSIVLVIIGLLAGGVLVGQDLVRQAELRSVSTDLSKYHSAINAFRNKYNALPGDMKNATQYWGAQHATPATCQTTASTGALTCDGNGDGMIGITSPTYYEAVRFWQHLVNAGLIEGNYTGILGGGGGTPVIDPGINCPDSKVASNAGFAVSYPGVRPAGDNGFFAGFYKNTIYFGGEHTTMQPINGALRPIEAYAIDQKMDDGMPGRGVIRAWVASVRPNCATSDLDTATYELTTNTLTCAFTYNLGF